MKSKAQPEVVQQLTRNWQFVWSCNLHLQSIHLLIRYEFNQNIRCRFRVAIISKFSPWPCVQK